MNIPLLIEWLKRKTKLHGDSSRQWAKEINDQCPIACYNAGAANTLLEVIEYIEIHNTSKAESGD